MTIYGIAFSLFLLMDAIGNVPIFLSILKEIKPERLRYIIFRELIIALFVTILFYFLGDYLLRFLNITQQAVLISGGIILFIIALKLVFPMEKESSHSTGGKEPFLVPLAIPLVAGPAVLATVMLYSQSNLGVWTCLGGIFIAWAASTLILISAVPLKRVLGERGLSACERLTGLLLIMIAVQMFLNGLSPLLSSSLSR